MTYDQLMRHKKADLRNAYERSLSFLDCAIPFNDLSKHDYASLLTILGTAGWYCRNGCKRIVEFGSLAELRLKLDIAGY